MVCANQVIPSTISQKTEDSKPAGFSVVTGQSAGIWNGRHRELCIGDLGALGPMDSDGGQRKCDPTGICEMDIGSLRALISPSALSALSAPSTLRIWLPDVDQ